MTNQKFHEPSGKNPIAGEGPDLPDDAGRVLALDGIRGVAILAVMLHHFTMTLGGSTRFEGVVLSITRAGWVGVELFFVLSGYLITGLLWDALARDEPRCLANFYARRVLRIFPLYYGVLIGLILIGILIPAVRSAEYLRFLGVQSWVWLYAVNIGQALPHPIAFQFDWFDLSHFWTLAVEENFYLLWPWVMLIRRRRALIGICCLIALTSLCLRLTKGIPGLDLSYAYLATLRQSGSLALGSAVALLMRGDGGPVSLTRRLAPTVFLVPGLASCMMLAAGFDKDSGMGQVFFPLTLGLAFSGLIIIVTGPLSGVRRLFESPFLRFFGKYSYGLYVFHHLLFPIWLAMVVAIERITGVYRLAALAMVVIPFAISVGLSLLSWSIYERPLLSLKRYFVYRPSRVEAKVSDPRTIVVGE